MVDRARYCFKLTAWNELAGVDDSFLLIYYVRRRPPPPAPARALTLARTRPLPSSDAQVRNDGSNDIEIQDPKHKKRFLTRIAYPSLKIDDVRPGGRIMIYARQYKVRAAAPGPARRRRRRRRGGGQRAERCCCLRRPLLADSLPRRIATPHRPHSVWRRSRTTRTRQRATRSQSRKRPRSFCFRGGLAPRARPRQRWVSRGPRPRRRACASSRRAWRA